LDRQDSIKSGGLQLDNAFWQFSLATYAHAGVAEECLALQEEFAADVNLVLFCAWMGSRGCAMSEADIAAAIKSVEEWHDTVVRPLRTVRQQVKTLSRSEFEGFRTRVKGIEFEAEQIEQAILFAYTKQFESALAAADQHMTISDNIRKYLEMKSADGATRYSVLRLIEAARRIRG
jgi:uncharacterized protein (TIGR02444 family)